jgi:DNA-binding transcriptional ArsR family regulator
MESSGVEGQIKQEILEIRREIEKLRRLITNDLLKIIENSVETKLSDVLVSIISTLNSEMLREKMPTSCIRYEGCINNFNKFLDEALKDGIESKELEALYKEKKRMLSQLENSAPYEKCPTCFSEALELLKKQEKTLLFFKDAIRKSFQTGIEYEKIDAEEMMDRLEPVSNVVRIKILLELSKNPMRFSQLSKATGLDGGNLRFHIKKLVDASLVVQHRKGGEYILTERGRIFLERLTNVLYSV